MSAATVLVGPDRLEPWVENFVRRHGETTCVVDDGVLVGTAADSSTFRARLPFDCRYASGPTAPAFANALRTAVPGEWGVLLVRRGGFAVARLRHRDLVASKVGQRHVQGRTKAGGQSQQRFARRRHNQARDAFAAAADHAARILEDLQGPIVTGGDHGAVAEVLGDARLATLQVRGRWLALPDPRRSVLDQAVAEATSAVVEVRNA